MSSDLATFLILGFAVYYLSRVLRDDEKGGPFDILSRLRYAAGLRYDVNSVPVPTTTLSRGLMCGVCNSLWLGALAGLGYYWAGEAAVWAALPFGLGGLSVFLQEMGDG